MTAVVQMDDVRAVVANLRVLLTEIDAGELSCSAAMRHRIEGSVLALEALTERQQPLPGGAAAAR